MKPASGKNKKTASDKETRASLKKRLNSSCGRGDRTLSRKLSQGASVRSLSITSPVIKRRNMQVKIPKLGVAES